VPQISFLVAFLNEIEIELRQIVYFRHAKIWRHPKASSKIHWHSNFYSYLEIFKLQHMKLQVLQFDIFCSLRRIESEWCRRFLSSNLYKVFFISMDSIIIPLSEWKCCESFCRLHSSCTSICKLMNLAWQLIPPRFPDLVL